MGRREAGYSSAPHQKCMYQLKIEFNYPSDPFLQLFNYPCAHSRYLSQERGILFRVHHNSCRLKCEIKVLEAAKIWTVDEADRTDSSIQLSALTLLFAEITLNNLFFWRGRYSQCLIHFVLISCLWVDLNITRIGLLGSEPIGQWSRDTTVVPTCCSMVLAYTQNRTDYLRTETLSKDSSQGH